MSSIFAIDAIADDITAEFTRCSIVSKVLVGEWESFKADASPRVILGLGTGEGADVFGHYAPGASFPTSDTTVARALWANLQRIVVWVAAPPPTNVAPALRARRARAATWALANETLRSMFYSHGGPFSWGGLQWLSEAQGAAVYGGALTFTAIIPVPVLDIDHDLATATETGVQPSIELAGNPPATVDDTAALDDGT